MAGRPSIHALPEGVLQLVFSKLTLPERLRLCTVCRQWQAILLSPPLLAEVTIRAGGYDWLEQLEGGTSWLVRRAAGSVQRLTIEIEYSFKLEEPDASEAPALLTGALAAVGAGGLLQQVTLRLGEEMSLPLGGWAAALRSLQQLSIHSENGGISVTSDLRGLTALQCLKLNNGVAFKASGRLPATLTFLSLGSLLEDDPLPPQVAGLTRLHTLHLSYIWCDSNQYGPLAALSGTLQSLYIQGCFNLPDCLPQMHGLHTLAVEDEMSGFVEEVGGAPNIHIFEAALSHLPRLERLYARLGPTLSPTMALPPGPWQRTLKQLAASAQLLTTSLPALGAAMHLQELGISLAGQEEAEEAPLQVLNWLAAQQALPLRRVVLQHFSEEPPSAAVANACQAVRVQHPHLAVDFASPCSCKDLLAG